METYRAHSIKFFTFPFVLRLVFVISEELCRTIIRMHSIPSLPSDSCFSNTGTERKCQNRLWLHLMSVSLWCTEKITLTIKVAYRNDRSIKHHIVQLYSIVKQTKRSLRFILKLYQNFWLVLKKTPSFFQIMFSPFNKTKKSQ